MVGTSRKVEELDSDGDAPELVSLSTGREEAQKLRKEEKENQRRVQAEAKQQRQRRIVQKKKLEVLPDKEQDSLTAKNLVEESNANPAEDEQELKLSKPGKISGLLDASIINFLSAQEKKVVEVNPRAQEDNQPLKSKSTRKRLGSKTINTSSRVKVVLLEADLPTLGNHQSALDFKHNRLYGDHLHRSLNMLRKPRSG